jgi:hypothetical protein
MDIKGSKLMQQKEELCTLVRALFRIKTKGNKVLKSTQEGDN